jgi:hypothetical protein
MEEESGFDGWITMAMLFMVAVILAIALFVNILISLIFGLSAHARDNGQYAQTDPERRSWFNGLRSDRGLCCSLADGWQIDDADWETHNNEYRVRIDGEWIDVPPEAVVDVPNKYGVPVVWPVKLKDGTIGIRCFLPGTEG